MICPNCDKEIKTGSLICPYCRTRLTGNVTKTEQKARVVIEEDISVKQNNTECKRSVSNREKHSEKVHNIEPALVQAHNVSNDVSVGSWLVLGLLMMIPIINIVVLIVTAAGKNTKKSKKNYAIAQLIFVIIIFGVSLLLYFVFGDVIRNTVTDKLWNNVTKETDILVLEDDNNGELSSEVESADAENSSESILGDIADIESDTGSNNNVNITETDVAGMYLYAGCTLERLTEGTEQVNDFEINFGTLELTDDIKTKAKEVIITNFVIPEGYAPTAWDYNLENKAFLLWDPVAGDILLHLDGNGIPDAVWELQ